MHFLTINIFLISLKMNFQYYALLLLFLVMSLTYVIYYNYLNFCYFTIFGSVKVAAEKFISSVYYFTKSVIYLRDIKVFTKELFQIRLTLISISNYEKYDCFIYFYLALSYYSFCYHKKEI